MTSQPEAKTFFGRLKIIPSFKGIVGIIAFRNEFINFLKKPFFFSFEYHFEALGIWFAVVKASAIKFSLNTITLIRSRFV